MAGFQRVGFFLFVLFFAGSVVLIAANELRHQHLLQKGKGDPTSARQLIDALRGDVLSGSWRTDDASIEQEGMPQRRPGSILSEEDRKELNSILGSILPSKE